MRRRMGAVVLAAMCALCVTACSSNSQGSGTSAVASGSAAGNTISDESAAGGVALSDSATSGESAAGSMTAEDLLSPELRPEYEGMDDEALNEQLVREADEMQVEEDK